MAQDEIVYVPVPAEWLQKVYALLGALGDGPSGAEIARLEVRTLDDHLVQQMYEDSEGQQQRLMQLMARQPDKWRYSNELAADLNLSHGARGLAGMFGAFGRRAKHRYGGLKPWEVRWDASREENRYRMSAKNARVILDAAASGS